MLDGYAASRARHPAVAIELNAKRANVIRGVVGIGGGDQGVIFVGQGMSIAASVRDRVPLCFGCHVLRENLLRLDMNWSPMGHLVGETILRRKVVPDPAQFLTSRGCHLRM